MAKKSHEEQEIDAIVRAQAANTVMWQKQAQAGAEMEKWVKDGHYNFIQTRVLAPVEMDCFKKVKSVKLRSDAIAAIARVQGTLEVFDIINARINNIIQIGNDALAHLKDLENSLPDK